MQCTYPYKIGTDAGSSFNPPGRIIVYSKGCFCRCISACLFWIKMPGKAVNVEEVYISWTSIEIQDTDSCSRCEIIATNRSMT